MNCLAARTRAAQEFRKPLINSKKFDKEIKIAYQVANILTHNLVQAVPKEDDRGLVYEIKIDPKRHELGDNESRFGQKSKTTDPCGCTTCVEPY